MEKKNKTVATRSRVNTAAQSPNCTEEWFRKMLNRHYSCELSERIKAGLQRRKQRLEQEQKQREQRA